MRNKLKKYQQMLNNKNIKSIEYTTEELLKLGSQHNKLDIAPPLINKQLYVNNKQDE